MKIGEARQFYCEKLENLREQQQKLVKGRSKEIEKGSNSANGNGVVIKLSNNIQKEINQTQLFLDKLESYTSLLQDAQNSKKEGEGASEQIKDLAKCIEIARRISQGGKVPAKYEKKLMEFSFEELNG